MTSPVSDVAEPQAPVEPPRTQPHGGVMAFMVSRLRQIGLFIALIAIVIFGCLGISALYELF